MNISNVDEHNNPIEKIYSVSGGEGDGDASILVSGSHLIYDPKHKRFIHVEELEEAKETTIRLDTLACLITSDHTIPIGKWIFHDWEDNNGSDSKSI
jgi:hypothetical protein